MALLEVKNLVLGYETQAITEELDFEIDAGDYLCIVGENGSGKTTLMKTLLGLHQPLSGTLQYSEAMKKHGIGYLPQQTAIQRDFPASVREVVLSGCLTDQGFHPFYGKKEKQLARINMERMNILQLADRSYRKLSGGQQQRVLLARALCSAETMLLLDEPVSGLDPKVTAEMYRLIGRLHDEGTTIVMISCGGILKSFPISRTRYFRSKLMRFPPVPGFPLSQ